MRQRTLLFIVALLALVGAMGVKGLLVEPPPVRAANAPGDFDAPRAKARLASILGDQQPHSADTVADDGVRTRLIGQLQALGLRPIVRDQLACNELYKQRGVSCARVRNVIAVLGPPTGKAVLLNAHYDSTAVGPGAADDGIGVATLLEVAADLTGQPLERPVILLFNEGEELGLVGARAFLADPLSRNVDSLINLEARGVRGPVNMFETSRPNAAAIALFASAVKRPTANSLSTDVYRLMPNYTDVNSFAERGWLTLNLAPIGNETRYHSPGDDLAALDLATLQHMGDQTLALTRALANNARPTGSGDWIFMDIAGRTLVTLPLIPGIILMIGLLIAFGALAFIRGGFVRSAAVVIGALIGSSALSWAAVAIIGALRGGMFWRAHPVWASLSAYASAILIAVILLATIGGRTAASQLRVGFWLLVLITGALIGLLAPGGIIFFLFPPLIALVGVISGRWLRPAEAIGAAMALLFFYVTWGGMLGLLEELLDGGPMWLFAPLGALLILPILIECKSLIDRRAILPAAGLVLIGWAAAAVAPAYSADRQQRFVIQHFTDADKARSWWSILNDAAPLPAGFGSGWKRGQLPFSDRQRWIAPAPADAMAKAPSLQVVSATQTDDERTITLRLAANNNDQVELIASADAQIQSAGVQGFIRPMDPNETGKYYIDCSGRSCDGLTLQLTTKRLKPVDLVVLGSLNSLQPEARPLASQRPSFARPQYNPDATIAYRRITL